MIELSTSPRLKSSVSKTSIGTEYEYEFDCDYEPDSRLSLVWVASEYTKYHI